MKRFQDYNNYLRGIFGERIQKISLDAGFNCPNRDGKISDRGCIFCNSRGSGSGALINRNLSIIEQINKGRKYGRKRYKARKFIAYFQAFSNTYDSVDTLKALYDQALAHPEMVGLSVGTRPDCVGSDIIKLLSSYMDNYLVWVEYGLQSAHDVTLRKINRGHDVACFEKAVIEAHEIGLNICVHVILGLPGESRDMMLDTARFLASLPISGIKIHTLYVVKSTPLADLYESREYRCLLRDEYIEILVDFLELLPPHFIIQRLMSDPQRLELLDPWWATDRITNFMLINKKLEERDTWQGKKYKKRSIAGI